jgi:AraC-like DNA-binding protein
MAIALNQLEAGPGWRVFDVVCDHGPGDRAFMERHAAVSIAAVTQGSFQYRTAAGSATMVPGSLLLGNAGACFECGHDHARGDRCLAFHFEPACFERLMGGVPGVRSATFPVSNLPPLDALARLFADAVAARDERDADPLAEIAVRLAGAVGRVLSDGRRHARRPSVRDERRITRAVRRIESCAHERLTLDRLAEEAAMSPYHFLHTFRRVTGTTPHQLVLRTRLQRAAARLRQGAEPVSTIAYDAGFNDLATFNRRFLKLMGATPSAFRAA